MVPVYIVEIIGQVAQRVSDALLPTLAKPIFYTYGRPTQITTTLQELTQSIPQTAKYPLIALFQDFPETRGNQNGYYANVTFPKIVIATLSDKSKKNQARYDDNFKPTLYPIYQEFMKQLARHSEIIIQDPNDIPHVKWDRPGTLPAAEGFNDFIDAIEITNLQLTFKQNCS